MKNISSLKYILSVVFLVTLAAACRSQKDTSLNRGVQNLTARYNILYNARLLLEESQLATEDAYYDDFSQVLPVYKEPAENGGADPILDSVITKAYKIVNEKTRSQYVDDAYYLIAKANYLKGSFYDAVEFFNYVVKTYPEESALKASSFAWKTRCHIQLHNLLEAGNAADSALKYLNPNDRKTACEVYASYAQYLIKTGKSADAVEFLTKAISTHPSSRNRIRWTYIIAQLKEQNNFKEQAFQLYSKVAKSNAAFEMAFNAELNRVRMEDERLDRQTDRLAGLRSMLKSDKNADFTDQIYYRIGDIYQERQQLPEAVESYKKATQQKTKGVVHKGLSYLQLAEIYFRTGNYTQAKAYYDTTLRTLPPAFPGYEQISRKSSNLELLANRYRVISHEDTLQTLARMNVVEREERIGELIREQIVKSSAGTGSPSDTFIAATSKADPLQTEGRFYFNNTAALKQGFIDFRRRWGNRPPSDNWRRGSKSAADITQTAENQQSPSATAKNNTISPAEEQAKQKLVSSIPLTSEAMSQSNERIAAAYYDIAAFYRDELKDDREAAATLMELLKRVPESTYKPAAYYNLYLLYSQSDKARSDEYKTLLLRNYPESTFSKLIINPQYRHDTNEREALLNKLYSSVYDLYIQRRYAEVIQEIDRTTGLYGKNDLSAQFAYLKALATGHLQKLPAFENALQGIADTFAADQLVVPLVRQHLEYIAAHRDDFNSRPTALLDYNPSNDVFLEPIAEQQTAKTVQPRPAPPSAPVGTPAKKEEAAADLSVMAKKEETIATATTPSKAAEKTTPAGLQYSMPDSAEYYFVVNVLSAGANLSPSRFSLGQFNRSKFPGAPIKHQLKSVNNENQLIFVGPFYSRTAVASYERSILPLIKEIMKIASERYNTFVISKQELDKLNTRAKIDSYLEFYKNYK